MTFLDCLHQKPSIPVILYQKKKKTKSQKFNNINMSNKNNLPKFVKMVHDEKTNHVSHLRLIESGRYYRDAGHWEVGSKLKDGELVSVNVYGRGMQHLSGKRLIQCSAMEYYDNNLGYVSHLKLGKEENDTI